MNVYKPVLILCLALSISTTLRAQNSQAASEEVIGKIKTALAPLFQENQDYTFSDLKTESSGGGRTVGGKLLYN